MADPVTGSFTGTGASASFRPQAKSLHARGAAFNVSLSGTFVGTVKIERSFDDGVTWVVCSRDSSGNEASYTAPANLIIEEPEAGVLYRLNCTAYSSGTITYRISQ